MMSRDMILWCPAMREDSFRVYGLISYDFQTQTRVTTAILPTDRVFVDRGHGASLVSCAGSVMEWVAVNIYLNIRTPVAV